MPQTQPRACQVSAQRSSASGASEVSFSRQVVCQLDAEEHRRDRPVPFAFSALSFARAF